MPFEEGDRYIERDVVDIDDPEQAMAVYVGSAAYKIETYDLGCAVEYPQSI